MQLPSVAWHWHTPSPCTQLRAHLCRRHPGPCCHLWGGPARSARGADLQRAQHEPGPAPPCLAALATAGTQPASPCAPLCRFIQVPVNLGMPEAWQGSGHTWSSKADALRQLGNGSVVAAAARMGVGVMGSAPLREGQLLLHGGSFLVSCLGTWCWVGPATCSFACAAESAASQWCSCAPAQSPVGSTPRASPPHLNGRLFGMQPRCPGRSGGPCQPAHAALPAPALLRQACGELAPRAGQPAHKLRHTSSWILQDLVSGARMLQPVLRPAGLRGGAAAACASWWAEEVLGAGQAGQGRRAVQRARSGSEAAAAGTKHAPAHDGRGGAQGRCACAPRPWMLAHACCCCCCSFRVKAEHQGCG